MLLDHDLELLSEAECRRLLATEQVGRIGVSVGALPAIFPVNYRMVDGDIVFRTGDGLKRRAALRGSVVGFEVDRIDPETMSGWSVLVVGVANEIEVDAETADRYADITPWAAGDRQHLVSIHPEVVSGRRLPPVT
ncbi:MAG TPA: pyridoxamine 5'-phosphate oxidase family protein [Acidimicrobiales bacterium]|nr:pyridoxamine 5'-phosphate oxidase family protein [Acidimicrobiales bacterium]